MKQAAIVCENLTFRYFEKSKPVIDNVSLTIPSGEITVLMGSSGCGKSTLAAILCGLLPENGGFLTEGSIELFGTPLKELNPSDRAEKISMMFQNPDLQFCMATLREELYFCMENIRVPAERMRERAQLSARVMGTEHLLDRKLFSLSGGEKQRAVLTCIHLLDASCILLDEPFANLDPDAVQEMMKLLRRMCREQGKTIVAIDHMADHWMDTADRFLLLGEGGRVLCEAQTAEELEQARPLFREQGVAYPGIWQETRKAPLTVKSTEDGLRLSRVTMPEIPQKPKKRRRLRGNVAEQDSLLFEGDAIFPDGCITAILGPSGCGKTSLMMTFLKQRDYLGDIVIVENGYVRELRSIDQKGCFDEVGIAFQNPSNQFITQNVTEEVTDGLSRRYAGETPEQIKQRALDMLDTCGLRKYQKFSPYMLSQGQQRRLAVLSVLAGGQKLLLLDEPTYGQDYRSARALMDQVCARVKEDGLTVIMTTHDRGLAEAYADVCYQMRGKKLIREDGSK